MVEGRKVMSARRGIFRRSEEKKKTHARRMIEKTVMSVCLPFIRSFVAINHADVFDPALLFEIRPRSKEITLDG